MPTAKLSSRERMLAALTRQSPDHVPFSPYIGNGPWFKEPMFWHDQFQRAERMLELGMDQFLSRSVDPLPQALVLTAIVISLGSLALMISICIRTYERYGTFDITEIRRLKG